MKKYLIITFLLFFTCGGSQDNNNEVASSSNNTDTTTTVLDTTTTTVTTVIEDSTTTTVLDTTTTTVVKNKCENCEYVSIGELNANINNVPQFAWNDYQRISNENIKFENKTFEIILNIGPSTDLYFLDNEQYIQKGISFWQNFALPEKYYGFFYNYGDLDWAVNELNSSGFEGDMARAPCRDGVCSGANSGIYQRPPHFGVGTFGINSADSICLLYTSPSPRDATLSRMPSSA